MKNPFVAMAIMAAAMMEAFREDKMRSLGLPIGGSTRGGRGPVGKRNPAGSKFILRAYRAKHGVKTDIETARDWYAGYLAAADAKVREIEATRKAARKPVMKLAA